MTIINIKIPSSNYSKGRTQKVSVVVIHWMAGTLAGTDAVFKRPGSQVSAHYGIENTKVHRYVAEKDTAYHAISANPYSIGIEHSAAPNRKASKSTYDTSIKLVADICKRHKLDPRKAVKPHNKYVNTQCPGTVNWKYIAKEAYNLMQGEDMYQGKSAKYWHDKWAAAKTLYKKKSGLLAKIKNLIGGK